MRKPILIAAAIAFFAAPAFADEIALEDVRAMSDDELYALAETLSIGDEHRLYQKARSEFPAGALGLQSTINEFEKHKAALAACETAIETGEESMVRSLSEIEPGRYFTLLRIASIPSEDVMDMTTEERKSRAKAIGRQTNRTIREFRDCKRKYRKRFGGE